jgi:ADP-heptose:LPS heptosyltransferase
MKKKILLLSPQGIGDFFYPLDLIIIAAEDEKIKYKFTIIAQYKEQYELVKFFCKKNEFEFYYSESLKINSFKNLIVICKIFFQNYDYLIIDPKINLLKQFLFSFFIRSKIKITKLHKQIRYKLANLNIKYTNHYLFFIYSQILFNRQDKYIDNKFNIKKFFKNKSLNILGIAPGSGHKERHKRWPKEYFVDLAKLIISKYKFKRIYIIGHASELPIMNYIKNSLKNYNAKIVCENIIDSIKLIKQTKMIISNDNGISHISRFLNIKTYIIAGPTLPNNYLNPKITRILRSKIKCSPCYQLKRYGCGNEICLKNLYPKEIFNKIEEFKKI